MPANVQYSEENEQESDRENWVSVTKLTIIPPPGGKGAATLHQLQSPDAAQSEFKESQYLG